MIRLSFFLIFLLQGFCLFHAFKKDKDLKWFAAIIFLPFLGSMLYLYFHVLNEPTVDEITENIKETIEPEYKIEKLEKEVESSDTFANKLKLGEVYIQKGRFEEAIKTLEPCLEGINSDSPDLLKKLLKTNYLLENYTAVVSFGKQLENEKYFERTDEIIAYAWALHYTGDTEKAEKVFQSTDSPFSNYKQRYELAIFLDELKRTEEAIEKTEELLNEYDQMDFQEKRMKKDMFKAIRSLKRELTNA